MGHQLREVVVVDLLREGVRLGLGLVELSSTGDEDLRG